MDHPYLLPRDSRPIPVATLRLHSPTPTLKITDPALRAVTDLQLEPLLTVTEDLPLEQAVDEMFRLGVRAFVVVRERAMTGLISVEDTRAAQRARDQGVGALRVADVMTPSAEVPAVDWQMVQEARVRDLVEIFDGSGAQHLLVVENEAPSRASVRGLVHRERLERQLGTRWPHVPMLTG